MSVSGDDFADAAATLALGSQEMDWRNAASRAYYGAFHAARLRACRLPDNTHWRMGDHKRLSNQFVLEGSRLARGIGFALEAMKRVRHLADYDISGGFAQAQATRQVQDCATLRDRIRTLEARLIEVEPSTAAR